MIILVDANSICHQSKHAMGSLSWQEKKVGVIFGFLRQILSLAKLFKTNNFVFAWDSRQSLRMETFPDYKKSRRHKKSPEEEELDVITYAQFDALRREILPDIGFVNNYMQEGYEADDIIASVVRSNPVDEISIVSTDEDLYQLLSEKVSMYSVRKKQSYTHANLWKDYKVTPNDWVEVKAMAGCSTDGVPGIPGVGEKTACKFINRTLGINHRSYNLIKSNKPLIDRNRTLVKLPFEGTLPYAVKSNGKLSLGNFLDICDENGFRSFLSLDTLKKWKEHVFCG